MDFWPEEDFNEGNEGSCGSIFCYSQMTRTFWINDYKYHYRVWLHTQTNNQCTLPSFCHSFKFFHPPWFLMTTFFVYWLAASRRTSARTALKTSRRSVWPLTFETNSTPASLPSLKINYTNINYVKSQWVHRRCLFLFFREWDMEVSVSNGSGAVVGKLFLLIAHNFHEVTTEDLATRKGQWRETIFNEMTRQGTKKVM